MAEPAVVVVKGPAHELRTRSIEEAVGGLLGSDDRTLALAETWLPAQRARDEEGGAEARHAALASALDGARTPPFGTSRRIVVIRSDDGFTASEGEMLSRYLGDAEPTTVLVLEAVGRGLSLEIVPSIALGDLVLGARLLRHLEEEEVG